MPARLWLNVLLLMLVRLRLGLIIGLLAISIPYSFVFYILFSREAPFLVYVYRPFLLLNRQAIYWTIIA